MTRAVRRSTCTTLVAIAAFSCATSALAAPLTADQRQLIHRAAAELNRTGGANASPDVLAAHELVRELGRANDGDAIETLLVADSALLLSHYANAMTGEPRLLAEHHERQIAAYLPRWRDRWMMVAQAIRIARQHRTPELFNALRSTYYVVEEAKPGHGAGLIDALVRTELSGVEASMARLLQDVRNPFGRARIIEFLARRRYLEAEPLMLRELDAAPLAIDIVTLAGQIVRMRTAAGLNAAALKAYALASMQLLPADSHPATAVSRGGIVLPSSSPRAAQDPNQPSPLRPADQHRRRDEAVLGLTQLVGYGPAEVALVRAPFAAARLETLAPAHREQFVAMLALRDWREALARDYSTAALCRWMDNSAGLHDIVIVRQLLRHGASVDAPCGDGKWPITRAAFAGTEFVAALLDAGADPNRRDDDHQGFTALHAVSGAFATDIQLQQSMQIARRLLLRKGDPNATDRYGRTPLHLAAAAGRVDLVTLLVEHGAHVNREFDGGVTARLLARDRNDAATEAYLASVGGTINANYVARRKARDEQMRALENLLKRR